MKLISLRTLRSMCLDLIIFLVPTLLLFYSLPHIFSLIMPFIIGFFLYFAANPLNRFLRKNLPASLSAFFSLLIISAGVFIVLRFIGGKIFDELYSFTQNPPLFYTSVINTTINRLNSVVQNTRIGNFSLVNSFMPGLSSALTQELSKLVSHISNFLINAAKSIPSLLIASFAAIFTTYFLLKEGEKVFFFCRKFFGEKVYSGFLKFKETIFEVSASYFKAQFIITGIIFTVLLTGFLLLKMNYAFILALLTALVDAVPVFGTGTMLLPMSVFYFLSGKSITGWGLLILYGITLLTRQICEPKILGKTLGIHPVVTVFALYTGMKLFGIFGLILGPFIAILVKIMVFSEIS